MSTTAKFRRAFKPDGQSGLPLCTRGLCPLWSQSRYRCTELSQASDYFCEPELRDMKKRLDGLVELGKSAKAFADALKKAGEP